MSRQSVNALSLFAMFALTLGTVIASIYWHLTAPDVTETRLLLMHLKEIVYVVVVWIGLGMVYLASND